MFNPLLTTDPSSLSDQQLDEKIVKLNKQLNHAYMTQSTAAINQFKNLIMIYTIEQQERLEIQMFKQVFETDQTVTFTVEDEAVEEVEEQKPKVEEREGGKLSLFRKIMNDQNDKK